MKRLLIATLAVLLPTLAMAAGGGVELSKAAVDVSDNDSVKRGTELYMNYCAGCHSAIYMRYNRIGQDLGFSDDEMKGMMYNTDKLGDTIQTSLSQKDATAWFGSPPPDLSVIARARGADWLYTYLTSFYADEKRPFGVNNRLFPDVGMPHVLWELEGMKKAVYETKSDGDEGTMEVFSGYEQTLEGNLDKAGYEQAALDLTNYMVYMGEPIQLERKRIGKWVMAFLFIFLIMAYLLKKEYWRDIH